MGYIAKGSITLDTVNDAYSVSLSKSSCVIRADFDGSNPQLDDAQTTITLSRGEKTAVFDCSLVTSANGSISATLTSNSAKTSYVLTIASIPANSLGGSVSVSIATNDGFSTTVQFGYTVLRESSMLDWIKDWEGSKTKIGGTYIMTPKLFIGKKSQFADYAEGGSNEQSSIMDVPGLTGVYIGPDSTSTGIYGYNNSVEIFHINEQGGQIGGWAIYGDGIYNDAGTMKILSEGAITATDTSGNSLWEIHADGTASFAKGNVTFSADGSASFTGTVKSSSGSIAGWSITQNQISQGNVCLDLLSNAIGVMRDSYLIQTDTSEPLLLDNIRQSGGVAIYYTSDTDWGLIGYNAGSLTQSASLVFSLGLSNKIAGWQFDESSLWSGTKNNTTGGYTTSGITIGSAGMRGLHWYIDNSGDISFMDGQIQFSSTNNGGSIVGWMLNDKRLSTNNVAIVSDGTNAGVYMTVASNVNLNSISSTSLATTISNKGGVYMKVGTNGTFFASYNQSGEKTFELKSNGVSSIAGWNFDGDALYIGDKKTTSGEFTADYGYMTISSTGIRSCFWRLEADGSGSLADGMIEWDADGMMTINATLSADNITSGTISTAEIKNASGTWYLKQDGSGYLANKNISWDSDGVLSVKGEVTATSGRIGDWYIIDGLIKSISNSTGETYVELDASNQKIIIQAPSASGEWNMEESYGSVMSLDATTGIIKACAINPPTFSSAISYISSNGIFSNIAQTNAMPLSSGYTHRGAIVGVGCAYVNKNEWAIDGDETIVAGVYGRASNEGTAATYGGFFYQLKACGLTTSVYYFTSRDNGRQLSLDKTTVIGLINSGETCTLYLPLNAHEGQEVEVIQMGAGTTRIDTNDGTHIFNDLSEDDYYDCGLGTTHIFKRVRFYIGDELYEVWTARKYQY